MKQHYLTFILILSICLSSCDNMIEYSPYQVILDGVETKRNETAVKTILEQNSDEFKPFKIALIGDSHTYYDEFEEQISELNKTDSIDFVIHMGDITLSGLNREFQWYTDIVDKLNLPVVTLIGNHDCLSNGERMYQEMFGEFNFSFTYNNCQLVFFDDNIWERNVQDPNFEWLNQTLSDDATVTHRFVFAHIQPWDGQFSIGNSYFYDYIMKDNNVTASIHGHTHSFSYSKHYGVIPYLVTGDSTDKEIVILEVQKDTILVNRKQF